MAGVDDYGDLGSNFLDSMLEVEMTEEDGEVEIIQTDDTPTNKDRDLPPIPRFDLQCETLSYKDVYGSSPLPAKQAGLLRTVPASMPGTTITVPVIQPAPMIVITSNLLEPNNVPIKSNAAGSTVPTDAPKQSPVLKALLTKPVGLQESANEFIHKVFSPAYVRKVFTKKEDAGDVSRISEEEEKYYKKTFEDVSKVQLCKLHCTICDKHVGCGKDIEKRISVHNMLKVLTCKVCYEFYGDGNFPCDDGDHCEIYCRWCGQGGALICCSFCPKVFCKGCVRRNYSRNYLKSIEKSSDWACFVCAQKPLWPHRAVCRALLEFVNKRKSEPKSPSKDTSICCKPSVIKNKIVSEVDRNKIFLSGGQTIQLNTNGKEKVAGSTGPAGVKNNVVSPVAKTISGNGHLAVKNYTSAFQINDQTKSPVAIIGKAQDVIVSPKIANLSLSKQNNVSRTTNSVPPLATISGVTIPHIINTPIYHGQTLITPPGAKNHSVQKKPLNIPCRDQAPSSSVKVFVTDSVNVDINKIPIAKIPHNTHGLILRLNFPDNKVQLVRLVTEGKGPGESPSFPMPTFENSENLDFLEGSLEDSFKLTKMLYERLMKIKERLSSKTGHAKESVYKSSVKKLSFIYEKARELMKELDDNLLSNYKNWKSEKEQENEIKVIDVSDDEVIPVKQGVERSPSIFEKKSKIFAQEEDSDLEAIVAATTMKLIPMQGALRSLGKRNPDLVVRRRTRESPRVAIPPKGIVDMNKFPEKRKKPVGRPRKKPVGRPRKRIKPTAVAKVMEKDPLAVSDGEEHKLNGRRGNESECNDSGNGLTSVIEIKEEKMDYVLI